MKNTGQLTVRCSYNAVLQLFCLLGRSGDGSALYAVAADELILIFVECAYFVQPVAYAVVANVYYRKISGGVDKPYLALYERSYVTLAAEILLESYNDLIANMDIPHF